MSVIYRSKRNAVRTRRRLLDIAIALFSTHGYHGVAVDRIATAARVNKRMIYHYFGSKDAIYQAALHEVYIHVETMEFHAVERGRSPREKLGRLLEGYFGFLDENPEFTQLLLWENLEKGKHIVQQGNPLTKNPFQQRFRQIVEEGIAAGEFRQDLNITHLLIHFIGLCFVYYSNRYSLSQSLRMDLGDPKVKAEGLSQVLELVFDGIVTRPATAAKLLACADPSVSQ